MKPRTSRPTARPVAPVSPETARREKPPFQRILVPIDFSEANRPALSLAKTLAKLSGGTLVLLHVREIVLTGADFAFVPPDPASRRERIEREIGAIQVGELAGVRTDCLIRDGLPFQEIVTAAEEQRSDLIVMATHGYTGLQHVLMGSTAERVVRHARCPVLVAPSHPGPPSPSRPRRKKHRASGG